MYSTVFILYATLKNYMQHTVPAPYRDTPHGVHPTVPYPTGPYPTVPHLPMVLLLVPTGTASLQNGVVHCHGS